MSNTWRPKPSESGETRERASPSRLKVAPHCGTQRFAQKMLTDHKQSFFCPLVISCDASCDGSTLVHEVSACSSSCAACREMGVFQRQIQPALQFVLHRFGSKFIPDWSQSCCSSLMRPVLGLLHPYSSEYMLCILGGSPSCDTCDVLLSLIIWL